MSSSSSLDDVSWESPSSLEESPSSVDDVSCKSLLLSALLSSSSDGPADSSLLSLLDDESSSLSEVSGAGVIGVSPVQWYCSEQTPNSGLHLS